MVSQQRCFPWAVVLQAIPHSNCPNAKVPRLPDILGWRIDLGAEREAAANLLVQFLPQFGATHTITHVISSRFLATIAHLARFAFATPAFAHLI